MKLVDRISIFFHMMLSTTCASKLYLPVAKNLDLRYPFGQREYEHVCQKSPFSNESLVHNLGSYDIFVIGCTEKKTTFTV